MGQWRQSQGPEGRDGEAERVRGGGGGVERAVDGASATKRGSDPRCRATGKVEANKGQHLSRHWRAEGVPVATAPAAAASFGRARSLVLAFKSSCTAGALLSVGWEAVALLWLPRVSAPFLVLLLLVARVRALVLGAGAGCWGWFV